jgi:hypothetical protein
MTTAQITIHNVETGEVIVRDMTADELAQHELDKAANDTANAEATKVEADKVALLAKLGITADEAKLLLS